MGWNSTGWKSGTKSSEETEDEESMNFIEELKKPDQMSLKSLDNSRENSSPSPTGERKEQTH